MPTTDDAANPTHDTIELAARLRGLEDRADELQRALTEVWQRCERLDEGLRTLAQHVDAIAAHSDGLAQSVTEIGARSWDQTALARRLAALEDHVTALLADPPS